jgi:hypothetical protein
MTILKSEFMEGWPTVIFLGHLSGKFSAELILPNLSVSGESKREGMGSSTLRVTQKGPVCVRVEHSRSFGMPKESI